MAFNRVETQIAWSAAAYITLNSNTPAVSDAFTLSADCISASIQINVDNSGSPATGDTLTAQVAYTAGDVLGDSGDDYDTTEHAVPYMVLDTYATNTPGEDPARKTGGGLNIAAKGGKLVVTWNSAAPSTRTGTVRARLIELRSA